jgi:HprK-related kinase A
MIVADLGEAKLRRVLGQAGLRVRTGPFVAQIRSPLPAVHAGIALHYANHPVVGAETFADFHVGVDRPRGLRRWFKPQVLFSFDDEAPFTPLPGDQGLPMLEWGLNWCVSSQCHQYLTIHAAVAERGGRALILPAPPGSGKSTLCAGLVFSGWRLLSDELALIEPRSGQLQGLARPVSLKNASIEVIRAFAPDARLSPVVHETSKGSIAHVQPPRDSVLHVDKPANPGWIVLPRYAPGAPARLEPLARAEAFMQLVDNAFNYHLHGSQGFDVLTALVDRCDCYRFTYSRLEEASALFAGLADGAPQ